jgi:peptidoglycan hydrolase-like protein with peptidoglycan-binding domain
MRSLQLLMAGVASVSLGACTSWLYGDQSAASEQPASQAPAAQAPQAEPVPEMAASDQLVRKVQQQLQAKGMDPGPIDGIWGPQTHSALEQFQQKQGLQASGQVDARTLAALGIEAEQSASTGGTTPQQPQGNAFQRADRNNDQRLNRQEFEAALEMR